jgi:hypothetical protein
LLRRGTVAGPAPTRHSGQYEVGTKLPLAWLLNTAPADHLV